MYLSLNFAITTANTYMLRQSNIEMRLFYFKGASALKTPKVNEIKYCHYWIICQVHTQQSLRMI